MGPLEPGTTLSGKYHIVRLVAEATGVIVYEAKDLAHAQRVFIKILRPEALSNAQEMASFQLEAGGTSVLDVGKSAEGIPYMVSADLGALSKPSPRPSVPNMRPVVLPHVAKALVIPRQAPPLPPRPELAQPKPKGGPAQTARLAPPPLPLRPRAPAPPVRARPESIPVPVVVDEAPTLEMNPFAAPAPEPVAAAPPVPYRAARSELIVPTARSMTLAGKGGAAARYQVRSRAWLWAITLPLAVVVGLAGWSLGRRHVAASVVSAPPVMSSELEPESKPEVNPEVKAEPPRDTAKPVTEPPVASFARLDDRPPPPPHQ